MNFLGWVLLISCYVIMHCFPFTFSHCFMHLDVCLYVENCVLIGLDWVEPIMHLFCTSHVHAYVHSSFLLLVLCCDCVFCFSPSLSLFLSQIDSI